MSGSDPNTQLRPLLLKSVRSLARILGMREESLRELCCHAGGLYSPFLLRTKAPPFPRRPFSIKVRPIDNPLLVLKQIQRRINERLLSKVGLPLHIFGGVKGKTIQANAVQHLRSPVIVTIDIRKFFASVKPGHVYHIWHDTLDCSPEVSKLLTQLTTLNFCLPQGAPTSTPLANLAVCGMDTTIRDFCEASDVIYSTWVDDFAFSGASSRQVIETAVNALSKAGFAVSRRKLKVMPAWERQLITGLLVNRELGITKERRSAIRSGIHKLATGMIPMSERDRYIQSLRSKIRYFKSISAEQANPLERQLHRALEMRIGHS